MEEAETKVEMIQAFELSEEERGHLGTLSLSDGLRYIQELKRRRGVIGRVHKLIGEDEIEERTYQKQPAAWESKRMFRVVLYMLGASFYTIGRIEGVRPETVLRGVDRSVPVGVRQSSRLGRDINRTEAAWYAEQIMAHMDKLLRMEHLVATKWIKDNYPYPGEEESDASKWD